jgi:hypothetical protein
MFLRNTSPLIMLFLMFRFLGTPPYHAFHGTLALPLIPSCQASLLSSSLPLSPSPQLRDQARRFITLVDELYNARVLLLASSEVHPEQLFAGGG